MQRLATAALMAFLALSGWIPRPASADETVRRALRQFGEMAIYVIEGGRNPPSGYKYSDKYDIDNGIAKSSALADSTYLNRVLLADLLGADETKFEADLRKIGKSLEVGQIMQSGDHYDLSKRIPLAIPENRYDTCRGDCLVALWTCTKNRAVSEIKTELKAKDRECLYGEFRKNLKSVIDTVINEARRPKLDRKLKLWADQPNSGEANISRYLVIALGTPVSFYSHNPKKPVGYTFDAKRGGPQNMCLDMYDRRNLKLQPGSTKYSCSDFDLKIFSPDLTYLFLQKVLTPQQLAWIEKYPNGESKNINLETIKNAMSLNQAIVDGGKRHVFKNDVLGGMGGMGVYQQFPALADFVQTWTNALGREVDIKLEFTFSTPSYVNLPNGPIALIEGGSTSTPVDGSASPDDDEPDGSQLVNTQ